MWGTPWKMEEPANNNKTNSTTTNKLLKRRDAVLYNEV